MGWILYFSTSRTPPGRASLDLLTATAPSTNRWTSSRVLSMLQSGCVDEILEREDRSTAVVDSRLDPRFDRYREILYD